jgi:hypothetical protein
VGDGAGVIGFISSLVPIERPSEPRDEAGPPSALVGASSSRSSARSSRMFCGRSSASFASALRMIFSSSGSTPGRTIEGAIGSVN